jgi:hypothetical protein
MRPMYNEHYSVCIFDQCSDKRRHHHALKMEDKLRFYEKFVGDLFNEDFYHLSL